MQDIPAVAQLFQNAWAEVFGQNVCQFEQALKNDAIRVGLQVKRDRFLSTVYRTKIARAPLYEWPILTGVITLAGRFDLDDPCAHVGQHHGAIRPGQHACEIYDRDARERTVYGHTSTPVPRI